MSSGATHDKIGLLAAAAIAGCATASGRYEGLWLAGGCLIGTYWLSPDLDLRHSLPSQRWGFLNFIWEPYRAICGHHRSFVSHTPIFSTIIMLAYMLTPLFGYLAYKNELDLLISWIQDTRFILMVIGWEIATEIHLFLDMQYSFRKRYFR